MTEKELLFFKGKVLLGKFCELNKISTPLPQQYERADWQFDNTCAYYRSNFIHICVPKCAAPGRGGRAWSWPGYSVDRTPYGVVQHELGHHVDWSRGEYNNRGAYWSDYSANVRKASGENKLTNYCPNDAEWFAEMFRLFVTNPDLLRLMRPKTHARLIADGFKPIFEDTWAERLHAMDALERTLKAAANKVK